MKCKNCPFHVDNSNKSNGQDYYCFFNDKEAYEFRNGDYGCDLTKKEVSEAYKRLKNIVEKQVEKHFSSFPDVVLPEGSEEKIDKIIDDTYKELQNDNQIA